MPQGCQQFFFKFTNKKKNVHKIGLKFLPVYVNAPKPNNNIVRKTKKKREILSATLLQHMFHIDESKQFCS